MLVPVHEIPIGKLVVHLSAKKRLVAIGVLCLERQSIRRCHRRVPFGAQRKCFEIARLCIACQGSKLLEPQGVAFVDLREYGVAEQPKCHEY